MSEQATERESMPYDVVIVGAGPSGLAAAIQLKQRAAETGAEIGVCVLEKGSEVGAHVLSGAVLETRALDELIPDWSDRDAPIKTPVSDEKFLFLRETGATSIPTVLLHTLVASRARRINQVLEEQATGLIAQHSERQNNAAA